MTAIAEATPISKPARWVGRILSGVAIAFLMVDGAIKLVPWPVVELCAIERTGRYSVAV